jgi:hypothetical protein
MSTPVLIDPSFRNYMFHSLQSCHQYRSNLYYYILNFGILFVFVVIAGIALYNCSLNKQSDLEKQQQMIEDQQYVMSKIRHYKQEMEDNKEMVTNITNLPTLEHF